MSKTKTKVIIAGAISGIVYFFYLYGMSTLGVKKDTNDNIPLITSDDNNERETIIGGSRKSNRKHRKGKSKKNKR